MNIVTQLMVVMLILAVGFTVIIAQVFLLARIYRSWSWWVGVGTFVLMGGRQIYAFINLPSAIIQAQLQGRMIQSLTLEQKVNVGLVFLIMMGFIVWMDWLRRDLPSLGIRYKGEGAQNNDSSS